MTTKILIVVEDRHQAELILAALVAAEEEKELNFPFSVGIVDSVNGDES